jgi:Zn-dependent peptidase ImmA (M78 family)
MKKKFVGMILTMAFIGACAEDGSLEITQDIHEELSPFFISFEEEASIRGLEVSLADSHIGGRIEHIEDDIVGQCWQNSQQGYIIIDMNYWLNASTMDKEFIVFHELGHCYLQREHLDTKDERGICTSIMSSGTSNCVRLYTSQNRSDLIDELFLE